MYSSCWILIGIRTYWIYVVISYLEFIYFYLTASLLLFVFLFWCILLVIFTEVLYEEVVTKYRILSQFGLRNLNLTKPFDYQSCNYQMADSYFYLGKCWRYIYALLKYLYIHLKIQIVISTWTKNLVHLFRDCVFDGSLL